MSDRAYLCACFLLSALLTSAHSRLSALMAIDGAPSARLPESEAGVESEAGLEPEAGDSLNLKPPAQTAAEPVNNNGVDAVHHDDDDRLRDPESLLEASETWREPHSRQPAVVDSSRKFRDGSAAR